MNDINNQNIPAFPFTADCDENKPNQLISTGMSLRDYFAAAALTGLLSKGMAMMSAVNYSYEAADQMLVRRNQTNC
jgi:hypothetical protein